jgi:hypothetical protein
VFFGFDVYKPFEVFVVDDEILGFAIFGQLYARGLLADLL